MKMSNLSNPKEFLQRELDVLEERKLVEKIKDRKSGFTRAKSAFYKLTDISD